MIDDILSRLDLDGIRDFPAELGAFSLESLCVRYSFTRDEYYAALKILPTADELPDHLKTVVHETTHLFQTTTTPFGMLIRRLRYLQGYLVVSAIRTLRMHGSAVSFPLKNMLRNLPRRLAAEVEKPIRIWYAVELFILIMLGETDVWEEHRRRNSLVQGVSLGELFVLVQYNLAQHFSMEQRLQGSLKPLRSEPPQGGGELPEWDAFKSDEIDLLEQARTEAGLLSLDLLSGGTNTLAIIESAGTAAEFWGCRRLSLNQFKTEISNASWASTTAPKSWLIWALRRLRATSLAEFILSYLVVCEVALFGPLLPQHQRLRKKQINLRELLPFLRWFDLLNAASDVPPMTSLGDYERYATALCRALGWTPPKEVVDASVASSPHMPDEPYERMYWKAQRVRSEAPGAFLNYPYIIARLPMDFDFPVIVYKDKTVFLKDKASLRFFNIGYLTRAVLRRMLLQANIGVTLPYSPLEAEKTSYTAELEHILEGLLGFRVPGISVS